MGDPANSKNQDTRSTARRHARSILAADGLVGLTYTTLSAASGVSRQTLYRYWPTLSDLLSDLPVDRRALDTVEQVSEVRACLVKFLVELHTRMNDQESAAVFAHLLAQAEHDPTAELTLRRTAQRRTQMVNDALATLGLAVTEADLALLVGPVLFWRFFCHQPFSLQIAEAAVDSFLAAPESGPNPTCPNGGDLDALPD